MADLLPRHTEHHSAWSSPATYFPPALILVVWWGLSSTGWFPAKILVPPQIVGSTLWGLAASGELFSHLFASLGRLFAGYALGVLIGLALGAAMGLSRQVFDFVHPTFQLLRQLPTIALLPVFVLVLGIGESLQLVLVIKATMLPVGLAALEGIKGIPRTYFDLASIYRIPARALIGKVVIPATLPPVLTGMRVALTRSWMVLVGAELLVAQSGLGQMMEWGRQMFRIDVVLVGVVLTGLIGFSLDRAVRGLGRLVVR